MILTLVDFDDTLVVSGIYFWQGYAEFFKFFYEIVSRIKKVKFDLYVPSFFDLEQHLFKFETEGVAKWGYSAERAYNSYLKVFQHYELPISLEVKERLRRIAEAPFKRRPRKFPGVESALRRLKKVSKIGVWTRGNEDIQKDRIERSGLNKYFDYVFIFKEKNTLALTKAINQVADVSDVWVVGNSFIYDIGPAREMNLKCILVGSQHHTSFCDYFIAKDFPEAVEIILEQRKTYWQV